MYETLTDYMTKLYAPFLDLDSASNVLDIALRNLNVSRDDILNDDTQLQKLLVYIRFSHLSLIVL